MTAGVSSMRFTSRDVKQLFPPEERTIIPVPLTDISTRNVILLRRFSTRSKNIVKLQLVMTSWQKFLRPLYVWLLHLSGFDKRFADMYRPARQDNSEQKERMRSCIRHRFRDHFPSAMMEFALSVLITPATFSACVCIRVSESRFDRLPVMS